MMTATLMTIILMMEANFKLQISTWVHPVIGVILCYKLTYPTAGEMHASMGSICCIKCVMMIMILIMIVMIVAAEHNRLEEERIIVGRPTPSDGRTCAQNEELCDVVINATRLHHIITSIGFNRGFTRQTGAFP
jgi:hypothetical protein